MKLNSNKSKINTKNNSKNKKHFLVDFIKKNYPFIGAIIFLLSVTISIFVYEGYDFFGQFLSELGVGKSAIYFNTGLIITGILLIPFYYNLLSDSKISKIFSFSGTISAIALIGVGLFPLTDPVTHFLFAGIFFIFSALTITINEINNYIEKEREIFCISQLLISIIILIYIFLLRTPAMQKLAVFLIIMWVVLTHFEKTLTKK